MLNQIHIRDFATISELQLQLENACTMITGETGAGKSIFIEAIEIALGGRASHLIIRPGKEKAEISLCFDITHFPAVLSVLQENDLSLESPECIIRRIITQDGRSRCYVNGIPVTVNLVRELGEKLFHLHGQHEQQVLTKTETQREMLDRFADHGLLVTEVRALAEKWRETNDQIQVLSQKMEERNTRVQYLNFHLEELTPLNLDKTEWENLESLHQRLSHSEELIQHIQHAIELLSDENSQAILPMLNEVRRTLEGIQTYESQSKDWITTLNSILIQMKDLLSQLQNYLEKSELDPAKIREVEEKISLLFNLARKHKVLPQELGELREGLKTEWLQLNAGDENLQSLKEEQLRLEKEYHRVANKLSLSRKNAATKLEQEITMTIQSLSLPHGEFKIAFEKIESLPLSYHGNEKIFFLIKTNPDQQLQPLHKVISGGELSRLSLAAHLALAKKTTIPTLIFDEVDTGLSGATAEKIGKLLRKLGESYQVFCVTHQAQVAACGHHHLLVEKTIITNTTHTQLRLLDSAQKTREIARMLGGEKITEKTMAHALEVLEGS